MDGGKTRRTAQTLQNLQRLGYFIWEAVEAYRTTKGDLSVDRSRERLLRTTRLLSAIEVETDRLLAATVIEAIQNGASWADIGRAVGTSDAGAHRRWRNVDPERPSGTRRRRDSPVVAEVDLELGGFLGLPPADPGSPLV